VSRSATAALAAAALASASCVPIQTTKSPVDTVLSTETVIGEPNSSYMIAKVDATSDGVSMRVTQSSSCEEKRVETVRRRTNVVRKPKLGLLVFELVVGVGGLATGAGILIDAPNVPEQDDPFMSNPISREQAYGIGFATLGVGALAALVGGIDLWRSRDGVQGVETVKRDVEGETKIITCNDSAVANQDVGLVIRHLYIPVGTLDGEGALQFGWEVVPVEDVTGAEWTDSATIAVGDAEQIRAVVEGGNSLSGQSVGQLSLEHARARAADAAWAAAHEANTLEAFQKFAVDFPEAHAADIEGEIAKRDVEAIAAARAEALAALWKEFDENIGPNVAKAADVLVEIAALAPEHPRLIEAQAVVATGKKARADELAGLARASVRAKDYPAAMEQANDALALVPDHAGAAKYLERARGKYVKALATEARTLARKGEYAAATDAVERAETLAPGDKAVARARKDIEKRMGAAEAKAARDQARAEQAAERAAEAERRDAEKAAARAAADAERAAAVAAKKQERAAAAAAKKTQQEQRREQSLARRRGDHKLAFRVDDRYADDNLAIRMRFPQDCVAKIRSKRESKDKVGTELHLVTTVTVQCEGFGYTIVKDLTDITATCEERTCGECEQALEFMLEPVAAQMKKDGVKLKTVRSCK
jgi:hypothetical protein